LSPQIWHRYCITQEIIISGSDSIAFIDGTWHLTQDVLLLTAIRGARTNDPVVRRSPSIFAGSNLPSTNAPDNWQTVTSIWSPDAQSAATSTSYGPIYVWDATIEVSPLLSTFSGHMAAVRNLVWNPTTNLIASGDDTGRIWVWNPETGQPVRELVGHTGAILDIDWRADGMQIVSTGIDSTLRTWDWPSGDMHIVQSGELISALAYSPDGTQLAYGGEVIDPTQIKIVVVPIEALIPPTPTLTPTTLPTLTLTPTPTPPPFTVGIYRAVQNPGDPRVYIERAMSAGLDPFDSPPTDGWTLMGRTNGAGDNGTLRSFTVVNDIPYAAVQHYSKGCIVITPNTLEPRRQGQTRFVRIVVQGATARCTGDWSGFAP
jgi:WD domain, G-beta repeat